MSPEEPAYHELCQYSLTLGDPAFLHQHVVDAFAAQSSSEGDRPIRLAFALIGLFLHVEKGLTGRDVQRAHMTLARRRKDWPTFDIPVDRGRITAVDVLAEPAGSARDRKIREWAACVWDAFRGSRAGLIALLAGYDFG